MSKIFDVFLSHNSKDKPWVIKLKADLVANNIKVWLDKDEIRPGDLFAKALEMGISESRSVALIISPESMKSGWVEAEYYRALNLATSGNLQLIPVLYKKAEIPGFLSDRSWVDFSDESEYPDQIKRLVWGITNIKPTETSGQAPDELAQYVQKARQLVTEQQSIFSSGFSFYPDQCGNAIKQADDLMLFVQKIDDLLPKRYDVFTVITGLSSNVISLKEQLVHFQPTCPPGDAQQREKLIDLFTELLILLDSARNLEGHL